MKKALMTASMASMLDNFNQNNIRILQDLGYAVTLAANFDGSEDSSPLAKICKFRNEMEISGCRVVHIDFTRKLSNVSKQLSSYQQLRNLATEEHFDIVHCNSPICAAMTRLAFRKYREKNSKISEVSKAGRINTQYRTRVIYTAHGFHFYKGAYLKNWLLYFPVEWVCAHWTDVLNTVNQEDYFFARKWLRAKNVVRLPGVGIDLAKFTVDSVDCEAVRIAIRSELGFDADEVLLLSVGELSKRKNQAVVIKALAEIRSISMARTLMKLCSGICKQTLNEGANKTSSSFQRSLGVSRAWDKLHYVICGQGEAEPELKVMAKKFGVSDHVTFLGYREDIPELCQAADLFIFPSLQEGMPMALLEAIAMKMPAICSDIRGNRELITEKELRFNPQKPKEIAACIIRALGSDLTEVVEKHYESLQKYSSEAVRTRMQKEYERMTS